MPSISKEVEAGQAIYTSRTLPWYDFFVLELSSRLVWQCPSRHALALYNQHVSANHLDVGVGSGYFLDRCQFPNATPRVALMDLSADALAYTAQRIGRYHPQTFRCNVLEPITLDAERFDSVGLNFVLHCLPGDMASKARVFDHLTALMHPGAVLFGSTLLSAGVRRSWLARRLMALYNRMGIFANSQDDLAGLERELTRRFTTVSLRVEGCVALFSCLIAA